MPNTVAEPPREIPHAWDEERLVSMQLPLADASIAVRHLPASQYRALPLRKLYKTYPIYHPDREPPGYLTYLEQQDPQLETFDLRQNDDAAWARYGAAVFQLPTGSDAEPFSALITMAQAHDRRWYDTLGIRVEARTGIMPYARYLIRERGKVEVGTLSCAMCHARVRDDGTVVLGAQGNFPFDRSGAFGLREAAPSFATAEAALLEFRAFDQLLFGMPWRRADPLAPMGTITLEKYLAAFEAIPAGALARRGTSPLQPVQIPDLIGVRDRRYLDRTGLIEHRGIGDLMRYAALNQAAELMTRFGEFVPVGPDMHDLPPSQKSRFSDEQLFALATYIYSLRPPANPYAPRTAPQHAAVARGKAVFERLKCGLCHRPPLYTNNALTPADGFVVPKGHLDKYSIVEVSLGTDLGLTLDTRRGTGYYKVPSLLGVWYRGPFEHNGSVATLEDWFDAARLSDDDTPTAWVGAQGTQHRAIRGHVHGLNLPAEDRTSLLAFLRTL